MWTRFMDMHSGGGLKEKWQYIFIEAPEAEAKVIFYNRFGHNPERVTCTCCGDDYSIGESESLEQASAYDRGCHYNSETESYEDRSGEGRYCFNKYQTIDEHAKREDVLIIHAEEIKPKERIGSVPSQGYVWVD